MRFPSFSSRLILLVAGAAGMVACTGKHDAPGKGASSGKTIGVSLLTMTNPFFQTLIAIGCRSPGLRKTATAAARRIGKVEVDHGDTSCKTPDAVSYIEKTWAHSLSKGFKSPAAHERSREPMRLRC